MQGEVDEWRVIVDDPNSLAFSAARRDSITAATARSSPSSTSVSALRPPSLPTFLRPPSVPAVRVRQHKL